MLLSVFELSLSSCNIPSLFCNWLWWWMICMLGMWKAVRWWWWEFNGAVDELRHHHPFIWQPTPTDHPVKLWTIRMFLFRICIRMCIRWIAGGCYCYFYWIRDGGEWCSFGAAALITMMVIVTLAVIVVEGRVLLPTGSDFISVFPVAVVGVGEGTVTLFSLLLPLLHRHCCLWCCVVVFIVVVAVERRCYLCCFRFSFLSLLLLSSPFSFFVFVIVSLSIPFCSVVLRISGVAIIVIWWWRW